MVRGTHEQKRQETGQQRASEQAAEASQARPRPGETTRPLGELRAHAEAGVVPALAGGEYRALLEDIRERGVLTPLEITEAGVVLDGHERLRAARELGLRELPVRTVSPADEFEYMLRSSLIRRHLSGSQRAALVVELAEYRLAREEGKERRRANLHGSPDVVALPHRGERTREWAARLAGVSPRTIQDAATVREGDPALFEQVKAGTQTAEQAARRVRQARKRAQLGPAVMPEGPFDLVYADPPWRSGNPESAYAPENHYPTMTQAEITALPIPAAEDAVLFLWATAPLLPQALEVMAAWGFEYKTELVWVKPSIGLGNWLRHRHEPLLLGRRGRFACPPFERRVDSVMTAERGRHSEKPECAYERLEWMYPDARKVELFARRQRPGWAVYGNEIAA